MVEPLPAEVPHRAWIYGASVHASVTRISDLDEEPYSLEQRPRLQWETGDYVAGEVLDESALTWEVEAATGRIVEVIGGDVIVGSLGNRFATLEAVGDWRRIGDDLEMHALTRAGVFGRCTSSSALARADLVPLRYCGHVVRDGSKVAMQNFALPPAVRGLDVPAVLIVGTSMAAGKTTAAKAIIRALKRRGLAVGAAKLTGVGRYRDILTMRDAGADHVVDFVDAGLPSTICSAEVFRDGLRRLLSSVAEAGVDVFVAEAGASPLEPYNGAIAIEELRDNVRVTVLCASDPYAVVGVTTAFGITPDVVSGRATSTEAGVVLIRKLSDVPGLNLVEPRAHPELAALLEEKLGV